jgi:flagellar biosynthesis protein FlhB
MADDKTEQPTPKRLKDARKKGQVAKSSDLTQAGMFLTAAGVLSLAGAYMVNSLKAFLSQSLTSAGSSGTLQPNLVFGRFAQAWSQLLIVVAPLLGALVVVAIAMNFLQLGGFLFSPQVLSPKFTKLNPVTGFQNIFFKSRTYLELIKNLIKFAVIFYIAYSAFMDVLRDVVLSARVGIPQAAQLASQLLFGLLFKVGGVFVILGAADFFIQKKMHMKNLRMSKEEVKKEYKEDEGDPHIKHQRKHLHQQLLAENMVKNVPKANVVVVNPTHLAIAIRYNEATMAAPQVTAKGERLIAQTIISIARRNRIPIVRNVPLAHSLIEVEEGNEIPEELYEPVAEILNWVYELARTGGV